MNKTCKQCGGDFVVKDEDLKFYDKVSPVFGGVKFALPVPEECPECRMIMRMIFRNESTLYHRECSKTGVPIISMYDEKAPFPVYSPAEWFGDSWDGRDYGIDFDFERPFFEQFLELRNKVPHLSLISSNNVNCDFCNIVGDCKDSYLIYGSIECENCYYGNPFKCRKCCDSLLLRNSELCLQCVDSDKLYSCAYCQNCSNSRDLQFCYAVYNSSDCFACVNLSHKKYCILNEQYSEEEYLVKLSIMNKDEVLLEWESLKASLPQRYYSGVNNEDVSGNYIFNSKNCHDVYGVSDCRDVKYCFQMMKVNDIYDVNNGEYGELDYFIMAINNNVNRSLFSYFLWDGIDSLIYCGYCNKNVRDCFGSVGLKHAQYCILNKQYSKEEYELMVSRIIKHMMKTGEWGEFFPAEHSSFAYNESVASEYFPLSREEVLVRGFKWRDFEGAENKGAKDAVLCEVTAKPFRIIPQERAMYERFGLELPRRSPKQRHIDRIALRNPMKLWDGKCVKCGIGFKTIFVPSASEKVYCEKCYQGEVY